MLVRIGSIIGTVWLSVISVAVSQPATSGRGIDDHLLIKESEKSLGENTTAEVIGTPYLNDTFAKGEVYFHKGNSTIVQARYNIYSDWIEYLQNNQTLVLDPDQRISKVRIEDQILVVDKYQSRGKIKHGYFTLLDSGKLMLLSKKIVTYREPQAPKALESAATPAKYTRAPDQFYYKIGNGELKKVDNIKELIADLAENTDAVKEFGKREKISPRKEEGLVKLVQFYNTL